VASVTTVRRAGSKRFESGSDGVTSNGGAARTGSTASSVGGVGGGGGGVLAPGDVFSGADFVVVNPMPRLAAHNATRPPHVGDPPVAPRYDHSAGGESIHDDAKDLNTPRSPAEASSWSVGAAVAEVGAALRDSDTAKVSVQNPVFAMKSARRLRGTVRAAGRRRKADATTGEASSEAEDRDEEQDDGVAVPTAVEPGQMSRVAVGKQQTR
jgi:hypothetical protein